MRDALPELGVEGRIGVNTGEVLTGTEERLATGDAVNVAARLEQAAEAGEVLLGAQTLRLVAPKRWRWRGAAAGAEREERAGRRPSAARCAGGTGALARVPFHRPRAGAGEARGRLGAGAGWAGLPARDGGRRRRRGKSRLVAEALDSLDARVVRGRCLPYGEGITYWPVIEVVKQLAALPSDPAAAVAVRSLLGESDQGTSADQIAWAFRKLLVEQAPLVVVLDDIQWGEETFLDLVEAAALPRATHRFCCLHGAAGAAGAPSRLAGHAASRAPERRRSRPADPRGGDGRAAERIAQAAGGNPLFIAEMLAMAREQEDVEVPPTLKALLAVRLDQLDEPERRVLERGSIEGELFHRGGVQALAPEEPQVTARLTALVRRELVRPDRAQLAGDDGFRFRHLLIRDAAYDSLPKSVRAELHERFADWLVSHTELVELDEIVGYHLEQACLYLAELGQDKASADLGARAAAFLGHAGRRAFGRNDMPAAIDLLNRACVLVPKSRPERVRLLSDLGSALGEAGRFDEAESTLDEAVTDAHIAGDRVTEGRARVEQVLMRLSSATGQWVDEARAAVDEFLPVFEEHGDDEALARLWRLSGTVSVMESRNADQAVAMGRALAHARRAGDEREAGLALFGSRRPSSGALRPPTRGSGGARRCSRKPRAARRLRRAS